MQTVLIRVFFALFALLFLVVSARVVFRNPYGGSAFLLVTGVSVYCFALFALWQYIKRADISGAASVRLRAAFGVFAWAVQLIIAMRLRYTPAYDGASVYFGAIEWAKTGAFAAYYDYYAHLSANLGAMFYCRIIVSLWQFIGGADFWLPLTAFNAAMFQLGVFCASNIVTRLSGKNGAGVFLVVAFAVFPAFWFSTASVYTDSLSLPYITIGYNLYLMARDEQSIKRRYLLFAAAGAVLAVGTVIKVLAVIAAIAIFIEHIFFRRESAKLKSAVLAAAAALAAIIIGFNAYIGAKLPADLVEQRRMPMLFWVYMGLNGSGGYDPYDFRDLDALPDIAARKAALPGLIAGRMTALGGGLYEQTANKLAMDFGDATFGLTHMLDDGPVNDTGLHGLVFENGDNYRCYALLSNAALFSMLVFALYYAACSAFGREAGGVTVPYLAMFGLALFLAFWEMGARFMQSYFLLIFIGGAIGVFKFGEDIGAYAKKIAAAAAKAGS